MHDHTRVVALCQGARPRRSHGRHVVPVDVRRVAEQGEPVGEARTAAARTIAVRTIAVGSERGGGGLCVSVLVAKIEWLLGRLVSREVGDSNASGRRTTYCCTRSKEIAADVVRDRRTERRPE